MRKLLPIFFLLLTNLAFGQITIPDTSVLRIDPDAAMGGASGSIYNEVTYIPLQNSKDCVVGEISKLEVTDKYFIVFDRGLDQVMIFNKDGSLHAKCAAIPGLHKTANMINNFNFNIFGSIAVNREKHEIVVRTRLDFKNLYTFNYDGVFKKKIPLKTLFLKIPFWDFAYLDGNCFVYSGYPTSIKQNPDSEKNYILHISNSSSSESPKAISYDPKNIPKGRGIQITLDGPFYYSGISGRCFFTRSGDYNLYLIDSKGIVKIYKVLLPIDYSVPADFLTNEKKYQSPGTDYLINNTQKVFSISDVYTLGDYLLLKLNNNRYDDQNIFLYNLKTGYLLNLLKVAPDDFSSFLPVISNNYSIQACDGKYIYSSFSSIELFQAKDAARDKNARYPLQLKKYFSSQTRKSNPVIVRAKLRGNL